MPETEPNPNSGVIKGNGSAKSQPTYLPIAIALLGVIGSVGTAYITAHGTAKETAKATTQDELTGFKLDQISGAMVGEIRAFAFGGGRADPDIKKLRALGWLECAGQAISHDDYPGSLQEDQLKDHAHGPSGAGTVSYPEKYIDDRNAERWQTNQPGKLGWSVRWRPGALVDGKKETSPRNVLVMYCIYAGAPVKDHTEDGSTKNN